MNLTSKEIGAILNTTSAVIHREGVFYDTDGNEVDVGADGIVNANKLISDVNKYTLKVSVDKLLSAKLELARQSIANLTNRRVTSLGVNSQYSIYKSTHTATTLGIYKYEFSNEQKSAILLDVNNGAFISSLWDKLYLAIDNGTITTYNMLVEVSDTIPVVVEDMVQENYENALNAV